MNEEIRKIVTISSLSPKPQSDLFEKEGKGYFYTHKGALACVYHNGKGMQYLGYVELTPNCSRANHYHIEKHENICVVKGAVKAKFCFPKKDDEIYEVNLEQGDIVHIAPGIAHSVISRNGAILLEYSQEKYKKSDTIAYPFKWKEEVQSQEGE